MSELAAIVARSRREGGDSGDDSHAAMQQAQWRRAAELASAVDRLERFIAGAGYDRGPWLAVAFGAGIASWFALNGPAAWLALILAALALAGLAGALFRPHGNYPYLRQAFISLALAAAAGCAIIWAKSALTGASPIERPFVGEISGRVVGRQEQPADQRTRLLMAISDPSGSGRVIMARVNVPLADDRDTAREGATVRLKARLLPPAAPMLPGGYDFARAAWFTGIAATGSALGPIDVLSPARGRDFSLDALRRALARHILSRLSGSPGGIAAALASGDRGAIAEADEQAMRDSGLTHLLSVSGLHVSAVIGGTFLLTIRLLALWPWLTLRVRLPLLAAGIAAGVGIFYAALTGAEVPTIRSVLGALLVLVAVALGRDALSVRLLAVAGFAVMLIWPEAVAGPSFQLSFGAVLTIVALHGAAPMRAFAARREEPVWARLLRHLAIIFMTGVAIELALLPIGLFHFHRAGVYGAFANVIAIPLTTFVTMPLLALALALDLVGAGAPAWWGVGRSLDLMLWLAHLVASQPGAVTLLPSMGRLAFVLFIGGGLWLALWHGRTRLWGLLPIIAGTAWLMLLEPPDVLISGDGRHVAFARLVPDTLVLLRETKSDFARENLAETAGINGHSIALDKWSGARCNADFCTAQISRGGRTWRFLLARGTDPVPLRDLAAACERSDIVIAARRLPLSCRPTTLKADRALLDRTGGLALDLDTGKVDSVAAHQGDHGWWHPIQRATTRPDRSPRAVQTVPLPEPTNL